MCLDQGGRERPDDDDPGDDDLLRAAADGDRPAFRRLMDRHSRPMLALAQRVTGSAHDADEIVQEAFLKVWTMAPRWRPDGEAKFSTWLYRVVLNACLDRRRRVVFAPLEEAGDPADCAPGGLDQAMSRQCRAVIAAALEALPQRQRAALSLYYYGEVSAPQAARILDMSLPALEALLVRGKRALRKALLRHGVGGMGDIV